MTLDPSASQHVPSPWRIFAIPGHSRLLVPPDATVSREDGDTVLAIALNTRPRTTVYASRWNFPEHDLARDTSAALEDQLRFFAATAAAPFTADPLQDLGILCATGGAQITCHAMVQCEADECWLARAISAPGSPQFLLIHWTGPRRYLMDYVIRIFESFDFAAQPA